MLHMYEANISVKILMQVNASSVATNAIGKNATMYYYFPSPRYQRDYVLYKQPYVLCK